MRRLEHQYIIPPFLMWTSRNLCVSLIFQGFLRQLQKNVMICHEITSLVSSALCFADIDESVPDDELLKTCCSVMCVTTSHAAQTCMSSDIMLPRHVSGHNKSSHAAQSWVWPHVQSCRLSDTEPFVSRRGIAQEHETFSRGRNYSTILLKWLSQNRFLLKFGNGPPRG